VVALAEFIMDDDAAEKVTNTAEARSYLERIAAAALTEAIAAAPDYSGRYRESLFSGPLQGPEPAAQLGSSSSFWHFVEFGMLETPPYHTLGEAVKSQVDHYEDSPKP
jgi:hypothetical protein